MTPGALKAAYGSSEVRDLYGGLGKLHGTHWANILSMCQRAVALFTVHACILVMRVTAVRQVSRALSLAYNCAMVLRTSSTLSTSVSTTGGLPGR